MLGLALAIAGSVEIQARRRTGRVLYVPIGALIFATTPMFWYWGTSGLETGLQLAWLGACWFGLCHRAVVRSAVDRPRWLLVLISLGPMVRPELAIYSVVLGAVILVGSGPPERSRSTLRALAWLLTPALGLQLARMGYYGSLLPNTAREGRWPGCLVTRSDLRRCVTARGVVLGRHPGQPRGRRCHRLGAG